MSHVCVFPISLYSNKKMLQFNIDIGYIYKDLEECIVDIKGEFYTSSRARVFGVGQSARFSVSPCVLTMK